MIYNKPTQCAHYALTYAPHLLHQFLHKNEKKKEKSKIIICTINVVAVQYQSNSIMGQL